jgi:TRAP-type C4-dicarboxylate transport system permease small subunit
MLLRSVNSIYDALVRAVEAIVVLCAGVMVLCVSVNVVARYFLNVGITWIEEISTLMFVWMMFLGAFVALRNKAHIALVFLIKRLPSSMAAINRYVVLALSGVFLFAMAGGGVILVNNVVGFGQKTAILRISSGWINASIPVSALLMLLEIIRITLSGENIVNITEDDSPAKEAQ